MPRDIVITRVFSAPLEAVWQAWSEPDSLRLWWGPQAFSCPMSRIDFRVGGNYLHCMRGGPELPAEMVGKDFWSTGVYKVIESMKKIVATDSFSDSTGKVVPGSDYGMADDFPLEMVVTLEFESTLDGKTKLTLTHSGVPDSELANPTQGWNESLDKLEKVIARG